MTTTTLVPRRRPTCSPKHPSCPPDHFRLVEDYRAARLNDEYRRDVECGGTTEEWAAFTKTMITFKRWLMSSAGRGQDQHGW